VRRRLVQVAALAALLVPVVASAAPAEELKALRGRIETLRKQLSQSEESRSEAADALRESERAISDTNRRLFELAGQQKGVRAELARLEAQRQTLERHVERQRALLARQLYQRYLAGQPEPLRLVLDRRDPADLARQMHYLGYVYRARARAIDDLRQDMARLEALAQQSQERGRELSGLQSEQVQQRRQLELQKGERAEVLAKVSDEVQQQRRQIDRLKADEQRLTRLVDQLAKALAAKKWAARAAKKRKPEPKSAALRNQAVPQADEPGTFRQLKGRMRLPVAGELGNRFGSPRADGGVSWKGLFIRAKPGEEVRAVAPGRIVFADWLRGFGNLVIVDHEAGYMSLYANNEAVYRQVGDNVNTGDPVASVGSSGGSPETGLYFELRYLGKPFDPLGWVSLAK
jgi:septal ring factor EnvC (AmiA/AmiB activator)